MVCLSWNACGIIGQWPVRVSLQIKINKIELCQQQHKVQRTQPFNSSPLSYHHSLKKV